MCAWLQIIVKEKGVFSNVTSPSTKAKLRLLFEVAPLALLVSLSPVCLLPLRDTLILQTQSLETLMPKPFSSQSTASLVRCCLRGGKLLLGEGGRGLSHYLYWACVFAVLVCLQHFWLMVCHDDMARPQLHEWMSIPHTSLSSAHEAREQPS